MTRKAILKALDAVADVVLAFPILSAQNEMRERLKTETFPTKDPALSDLVSSEVEEAICRLLDMQAEMLGTSKA